jgi:long-chain acyl-CoA synthetase
MVVGENEKHPSALISPNTDTITEWCKRHNHTYPGDAEIGADKVISDRVMQEVNKLMEPFSQWERVKVIRILPEPFSIEGGELTPTLKLKRKPIQAKYTDLIKGIYE